ncbi:hypothetical protein [Desulfurobacterium sp.]|uniref:hypothetical protein n=1 Tax=Desulfurobacterium sp. TaxID=2004706 RepID=UPI00262E9199|nr:hypothetical protein [Desulfurobacterium sp.]
MSHVFKLEQDYDLEILHVKYEEFLGNPVENIKSILNEINLSFTEEEIKMAVGDINPNRKYAFLSDKNLVKIYENIKED